MTRSLNTNRKVAGVIAYGGLLLAAFILVATAFSQPAQAQVLMTDKPCMTAFEVMSERLAVVHNTKIDEAIALLSIVTPSLVGLAPGTFDEIIWVTQSREVVFVYLLKDGRTCNVIPAPRDQWLEFEKLVWGIGV